MCQGKKTVVSPNDHQVAVITAGIAGHTCIDYFSISCYFTFILCIIQSLYIFTYNSNSHLCIISLPFLFFHFYFIYYSTFIFYIIPILMYILIHFCCYISSIVYIVPLLVNFLYLAGSKEESLLVARSEAGHDEQSALVAGSEVDSLLVVKPALQWVKHS